MLKISSFPIAFLKNSLYLILVIFVCSCSKDWLEEKADKTLVVPQTLDDLQGLLDNVSQMSQQFPTSGEIASDLHYIADASFEFLPKDFVSDAYIWSYTIRHDMDINWVSSYYKVLVDNIILDRLDKITPFDQNEINRIKDIKGQALMNRARIFFELAQIYAPPYDSKNLDNKFGIVLRLSSDITQVSTRSTLKATYEQIIKDLTEAVELLPNSQIILTRGSRCSAYALLARVYLCMEEYENSLIFASKSLEITNTILDYNTLQRNKTFIGRYPIEVLMHTNYTSSIITSLCLIDSSFFATYNNNDLRKPLFFRINANGTIAFRGNYDSRTTPLFNGLTTSEVLLTRSECYARLNKTVEAMADLNILMKKRWDKLVSYPIFTATSSEDALKQILNERKKELILRGIRWMDLRRLNKDPRFAITLTRKVNGQTYTLEPNSYRYTFPIPDDIIDQTGIDQNPGWE